MCNEKETGTWLPVVKETVDAIYNYLIPHQDGIKMSGRDYGRRGARVCTELVGRNIIEKKVLGRGKGCRYKWVATMPPTKVLYGSIAQKLHDEERKYKDTFKKKMKEKKETPAVAMPEMEEMKSLVEKLQEMWKFMQDNGVTIENDKLVLTEVKVTKTVLS